MTDTPSFPDIVADHDRVQAAVQRLVDGVRPEQWTAATPCTDWDVRALLNHVATGNLLFTANIRGETPPDRSLDHLGEDPSAAFAASGRALREAFLAPGTIEGTFASPMGPTPGPALVLMRTTELLVHGWDLARATGQEPGLPEDIAERTLAAVQSRLAGMPRAGGPFAEEQAAPPGAPASDRLAAFLGRPVQAASASQR
jgi:uncharacterized protein (TIGR03086 family)